MLFLPTKKMAAILLDDRRLTDLKVTELKSELEKRGLPKKGVKSVLVERLKKAILQEELSNVSPPPHRRHFSHFRGDTPQISVS